MSDWVMRSIPADDYLEESARVVRDAFAGAAREFGINETDCPDCPAFETAERLRRGRKKGLRPFGLFEDGTQTGFVAVEREGRELFRLESLAVAPGRRNEGRGRALVEFALRYAASRGGTTASIGTFAGDERLRAWFLSLGFREREKAEPDSSPFQVVLMDIDLSP